MGFSDTFQFNRAAEEFAAWQAVAEADRSPAPSWWWSSALALRDDTRPLPRELSTGLDRLATTYRELARKMLEEIGSQTSRPWPDEFPTKRAPHRPDAAASAETAAQAASAAANPIS